MCLFKTLVKMEKKISGQYFYVNVYVFISDDCNVALTYQGQLFTHANGRETPSDKKCEPFSLSAWSRDFYIAAGPVGFHLRLSSLPVAAFGADPQRAQHCFIFSCEDGVWCHRAVTAVRWRLVDPPQVLTRAARDRHLHCTECLDGVTLGSVA